MIVQGRYIGKTEYNYMGMNIIHNHIYSIEILPKRYGYNWVVNIYDSSIQGFLEMLLFGCPKLRAWMPYDSYPDNYWVTNDGTKYNMINMVNLAYA